MKPWRIIIDTNPDVCNLRCIMCDTHSGFSQRKRSEISCEKRSQMGCSMLEKVFYDASRIGIREVVPTTMGEPLLYKYSNRFWELTQQYGFKLNLTTNGTFPGENTVAKIGKRLIEIASDIKISLNSIDPTVNEKIMVNSDTRKVLENLDEMIKFRNEVRRERGFDESMCEEFSFCEKHNKNLPTITLQVTFMKSNMKEIEKLITYAVSKKVDRVKGHQLFKPWGDADSLLNKEAITGSLKLIEEWNQIVASLDRFRPYIELTNFCKISKKEKTAIPDDYECPFLGNEIWVNQDGEFNVCCAPSELRKTFGDFGNINNQTIQDIFESQAYRYLCKNYKHHKLCGSCTLRKKY